MQPPAYEQFAIAAPVNPAAVQPFDPYAGADPNSFGAPAVHLPVAQAPAQLQSPPGWDTSSVPVTASNVISTTGSAMGLADDAAPLGSAGVRV